MTSIAVVDVGSNTVKLTVFRCASGETPQAIASKADTVRISHRLSETGLIERECIEKLLDSLSGFEEIAREHGANVFLGVGTQALRIASNSDAVINEIRARTSWKVRVLPASEEIRLTIEGARPWLSTNTWSVVADIGGASSEIISVLPNGDIWRSGSVELGSGKLFDEEIGTSPPPDGAVDRCLQRASGALTRQNLLPEHVPQLVLPGGTGQFLHVLLEAIAPSHSFNPEGIRLLHTWLNRHTARETMSLIPVQIDRARVLPASLAIVEALVLRLTPVALVAIPGGIRDGIARDYCRRA